MRPELNPFTPGSGLKPPTLAGREAEIAAFDLLVAQSRRARATSSIVLYGYRGVGKTTLLNAMRAQATTAGWLCIDLEAQTSVSGAQSVRQQLARRLGMAAVNFKKGKKVTKAVRHALSTLESFSFTLGAASMGFSKTSGTRKLSGNIEVDLEMVVDDFAAALKESNSAIGVFIDEMQDLDEELLSALLTVQNRAGQNGIPFYVVGAGLPTLPALLARSRSYAERLFTFLEVGPLTPDAARRAIVEPLAPYSFNIEESALQIVLTESGGYPFFLQIFGRELWLAADERRIDLDVAHRALTAGLQEMDRGIFRARWDRTTAEERDYLRAMVATNSAHPRASTVAASANNLSDDVRASLVRKGIIFVPEPGAVAFTMPGMPSFIARRDAH